MRVIHTRRDEIERDHGGMWLGPVRGVLAW
jgi:hypothetical protein